MTQPIVRYCHGCEQYDTAPRARHIVDARDPSQDQLFHYQLDCIPQNVYDDLADGTKALVEKGHKDDELRAGIVEVAKSLPEPEPDEQPHLIAAGYTPDQIKAHIAASKEN